MLTVAQHIFIIDVVLLLSFVVSWTMNERRKKEAEVLLSLVKKMEGERSSLSQS